MVAERSWGSVTKCGTKEGPDGPSQPYRSILHIRRGCERVIPVPNFKKFLRVVERNPSTDHRACNGLTNLSVEGNRKLMKKAAENYAKYGMTEPTTVCCVNDGPSQGSLIQTRFGQICLKQSPSFIRFCFVINSSKNLIFWVRPLDIFQFYFLSIELLILGFDIIFPKSIIGVL